MSQTIQSGAGKKRWPWWVRLMGWLTVPLLALTILLWLLGENRAKQHPRGSEGVVEDVQALSQLKELEFSLWLEKRKTGRYPSEKDGGLGAVVLQRHRDKNKEEVGEPREVTEKLKDPWGRRFKYRFPGVHNKDGYDLYSLGADGIEDTEDDIKNW